MKARRHRTAHALGPLTSTLVLVLGARDARAAGTALDVQAARGTGMASAMTAATDDSSSIYYNPAGIARGKILDAQVGDTLIVPSFSYKNPEGHKTSLPFYVVPPFNAYVSGGITEELSVGIGVFTPFGSRVRWPDGWEGRRQIQESNLATYYFNPTVAYRLGPVRIGAGFQLVRGTVELKRSVALGSGEGQIDLGGGSWGYGGNVGVQVDAIERWLTLGVHYRSAVRLDFDDGAAHFSGIPRELQTILRDQKATTGLTQPDQLAFGISSRPTDKLLVDLDVVWFGWSKFRSIDIRFPEDASNSLNISQAKNWSNTVNYRIGAEYAVSDSWHVRGGVLYDPTPSPDNTLTPDIPDSDRLNLAAGGSYIHPCGFRVDLGYQFLVVFNKTSTAPGFSGDYGGFVQLLGLSVGYRTPAKKPAPPPLPPTTYEPPPAGAPPPIAPEASPPPPAGASPPIAPEASPPAPVDPSEAPQRPY